MAADELVKAGHEVTVLEAQCVRVAGYILYRSLFSMAFMQKAEWHISRIRIISRGIMFQPSLNCAIDPAIRFKGFTHQRTWGGLPLTFYGKPGYLHL